MKKLKPCDHPRGGDREYGVQLLMLLPFFFTAARPRRGKGQKALKNRFVWTWKLHALKGLAAWNALHFSLNRLLN